MTDHVFVHVHRRRGCYEYLDIFFFRIRPQLECEYEGSVLLSCFIRHCLHPDTWYVMLSDRLWPSIAIHSPYSVIPPDTLHRFVYNLCRLHTSLLYTGKSTLATYMHRSTLAIYTAKSVCTDFHWDEQIMVTIDRW